MFIYASQLTGVVNQKKERTDEIAEKLWKHDFCVKR